MHITRFLERLEGVRKSGTGWTARCPAHDDRHASLTINEGDDGRILVRCHAGDGCPTNKIVGAIGLTLADLYPDDSHRNGHATTAVTAPPRRIVATYDYTDESRALLYQVVRYDPKQFRQRRPHGKGGWLWNLDGMQRVLYRLPEVIAAVSASRTVYIVEGEKDAEALAGLGLCATTNAAGAGKWNDAYSETLRGANVVILPDNDEPGRQHARAVARSLLSVGAAVKIVELSGLPPKGDVSDWLAVGGMPAALFALAKAAPSVMEQDLSPAGSATKSDPTASLRVSGGRRQTIHLMNVEEWAGCTGTDREWLLDLAIPLRHCTCLSAKQKVGKSTLLRNLISAVVQGRPFLDRQVRTGSVVYLPLEDPAEVLAHFRSMGVPDDVLREQLVIPTEHAQVSFTDKSGHAITQTETRVIRTLEALEEAIRQVRPVLVVIDPIVKFIRFTDLNAYERTYRDLEPLLRLALVYSCGFLFTHHEGKADRENVGQRSIGSTALPAIVSATISMQNRAGTRTLESEGRGIQQFDKIVLGYDEATGILTGAGRTYAEVQTAGMADRLLSAARKCKEAFSREALLELVEGKREVKQAAFAELVFDGLLAHISGKGTKGNPKLYQAAANSGSPVPAQGGELREPEFRVTIRDQHAGGREETRHATREPEYSTVADDEDDGSEIRL